MSKLPFFERFLGVGNLKPKLKWFFFQGKRQAIFFLLNCHPDGERHHVVAQRQVLAGRHACPVARQLSADVVDLGRGCSINDVHTILGFFDPLPPYNLGQPIGCEVLKVRIWEVPSPAWAVCSFSRGPPAGVTPQSLVFKTLQQEWMRSTVGSWQCFMFKSLSYSLHENDQLLSWNVCQILLQCYEKSWELNNRNNSRLYRKGFKQHWNDGVIFIFLSIAASPGKR